MKKITTPREPDTIPADLLDFRILNWIGIIDQLSATKVRQHLEGTNVPPPQFALLNHFGHRPLEGKTVTKIASAMQQPQPGITKTITKMLVKGFLREEANPEDGRSKILFLTKEGASAHAQAKARLIDAMDGVFDAWSEEEKRNFYGHLDKLKVYFDAHR